jgi:trehalose 6-phosphate synthase
LKRARTKDAFFAARKDQNMPKQIQPVTEQEQASPKQLHVDHVIVVTNRGPVEYYLSKDKTLKSHRGSGGVVTALLDSLGAVDATWVALAMTEGDRKAVQQAKNGDIESPLPGKNIQLHYMTIPKKVYHNHYDVISNQLLWFAQHYMLDNADGFPTVEQVLDAWGKGYTKANTVIADAVDKELERTGPSTLVMLHDYHLYLASTMIRERHPEVVMQQFIHIPWPEIRYWQSHLPTSIMEDIFSGLLGNDMIGFQTRRDAQNFLEGVHTLHDEATIDYDSGIISWQNRHILVKDYPISISVTEERHIVQSQAGKRASRQIQRLLGKYTIIRVDRIEPTKNIVQGFQAYQHLLEEHPELLEEVTFLAFLVPSRESIATYRKYKEEILQIIDETNQKFGKNEWVPIRSFVQNDRTMALAALQFYDALLVNALIDGMNLVAKEGAAVNQKDGVLVLSRTSGAFQQLENASISISPNDTTETAEALYKALTMPQDERKQLAERARHEVEQDDLNAWIDQQVHDINQVIDRKRNGK